MNTSLKILKVLATPFTIVAAAPAAMGLAIVNIGTWTALHATAVYKKRWGFTRDLAYSPFLKSIHDGVSSWWSPLGKFALGGAVDVARYTEHATDVLADYEVRHPKEAGPISPDDAFLENSPLATNNSFNSTESHTSLENEGVSAHSETEERERMIALAKAEKKKAEDKKREADAKAKAKAAEEEVKRIAEAEASAAEEARQKEVIENRKKEMEALAATQKAQREEQENQRRLDAIEARSDAGRNAEALAASHGAIPSPKPSNPVAQGTPIVVGGRI